MSAEKKLWHLPTPFRRFSTTRPDSQLKRKPRSRSRVSSVYLSDNSSTGDFIIVPEFNDPILYTQESDYTSYLSEPATTPRIPLAPNSSEPTCSQCSSSLDGDSCDSSAINSGRSDDLSQRLDSAYEQILLLSPEPSTRVSLSSDPQILRKQLGVPQHSVLNYPSYSSPDLPNPHTCPPRFTTPPILSPPTSSEVPHRRTSKNLGLRIDTNIYPASPGSYSPETCQLSHIKSPLTAPNLNENFTERNIPEARMDDTQVPSSAIPASSRLSKRRIDKSIVSPSSFSATGRPAPRGVLRKSAAGSPPHATTAYRRQVSLPQIKPPSPFRVDIPLHHTWHDRRSNFYSSSSECHTKVHEPKPRRTSGSTEVLASLAWIGTPPMTSSPHFAHARHQSANPAFSPDHFRTAIAMEDDTISDDALVDRLEKVRRIGSPSEWSRASSSSVSAYFAMLGGDGSGQSYTSFSSSPPPSPRKRPDTLLTSVLTSEDMASDPDDAAVWHAARKAVLCIREMVRTEKKYQEALKMLLNAETVTPPPPSMTPHVSALVCASETLLKHFLEDPSAWGVSTAFVASEDELEATLVSWCAVAGTFFTDVAERDPQTSGSASRWRLRKSVSILNPSAVMKQTSTPLGPQLPPIFSSVTKGRGSEEICTRQYPRIEQGDQVFFASLRGKPESSDGHGSSVQPASRRLSVRDLAIQPIQRVMRYVLLYRDLLDCTPMGSPSRLLVERALESATRIARHCDRAQRNPAFFHAS